MVQKGSRYLLLFISLCVAVSHVSGKDPDPGRLGVYTDRLIVANQTLVFEPELSEAISGIGNRLAAVSGNQLPVYSYRILNNPQINVFSTDGGFIYITTGMLDTCTNVDEIAALLAREIVHTNGAHQARFIREEQRKRTTASLVSSLLGVGVVFAGAYIASRHGDSAFFTERQVPGPFFPYSYGDSVATAFASRMLADLGPRLSEQVCAALTENAIHGLGEKLELEADTVGLQIMERAGFKPQAMLAVLEKLKTVREQAALRSELPVSNPINAAPGLEKRMERMRAQLRGKRP